MAIIRPFKAVRPIKDVAPLVASVPYDVVNREEASEFAEGNSLSYLHITRSEIDLPKVSDVYSKEIYLQAKSNLERIINEAPLKIDEKPHFYLYRLIMDGRAQTGICATFSVDDYDNDVILKHEKTRKVKEDDRTNHIITTNAQTGVVFLTYRGVKTINDVVDKTLNEQAPEYDFVAADGIQHTVWILPDEYNDIIINEFSKINKLYIADGHHRAKSASRSREEKVRNNPSHNGDEEYNYFIAVIFPAEQLKILPYNRVVIDLNGLTKEAYFNLVKEKFFVTPVEEKEPKMKKEFCMYIDKQWYLLKPRESVIENVDKARTVGDKLDVSILQNFLLSPILGIDDPRTSNRIDFIGGIRGTKELEMLVDSGRVSVAFSLYPVELNDLMNISDSGEVMPPKSTWFEPKLRDGLLTHLI
ncbi:MAG: DUF1015 domain-containing protein [Ignavibacteriales bacterium]|nr:DUF1015 domain-containing protein [Ignavibacteriales bacterium]